MKVKIWVKKNISNSNPFKDCEVGEDAITYVCDIRQEDFEDLGAIKLEWGKILSFDVHNKVYSTWSRAAKKKIEQSL